MIILIVLVILLGITEIYILDSITRSETDEPENSNERHNRHRKRI